MSMSYRHALPTLAPLTLHADCLPASMPASRYEYLPHQTHRRTTGWHSRHTNMNHTADAGRKLAMAAPINGSSGWTLLRPLCQGASGAAVSLAEDAASGELFVVKSAAAGDAAQLRREWGIMSGLSSPHVVKCLGFRSIGALDHLLLEFAPGGSLADVAAAARNGGGCHQRRGLEEEAVRAYAADVLRGLDYLHERLMVHGDVKGRNVVVGADGRAKLADFGCARAAGHTKQPFGGTPTFMAPEVARGEEQGPPADVWALGCTVLEMATGGRVPWGDADDNVLAVLHRIGFTDAVPEVPQWLSPEAKDFLGRCLRRRASDRDTAAQLLEHPFVALATPIKKEEEAVKKRTWESPTSTLDAALWESDFEPDDDDMSSNSPVGRIRELACTGLPLPDWDPDQGWIEVCSC
ncbi:mitogen-activated protein kinase kinase kinase 18-like [Triticum aestivum]|uniref:mitogen-activated protein kinase kinase kinase 18-like n=1 Tax=Triticum aestivum TaxID=4565 RepID=UPI001D014E46|nr:mitogen-activated protein kinase kinase kinase 18-like [Triticum aestivum]